MKTLEVDHAKRCNPNPLHNTTSSNSNSPKHKTWIFAVDKSPHCTSFQSSQRFVKFEVEEEGKTEYKYIKLGCGNPLVCCECGKTALHKKLSRTYSLAIALGKRFPTAEMASIVFTVPHAHNIHKFPSLTHFQFLFKTVHTIISKIFPGCPHLSVLHTWSSKDPNNKHIHIHCLIFGIREDKTLPHLFFPSLQINSLWQKMLNYPLSTNIHMKYWLLSHKPKTSHALKYTLRSPILDFDKHMNFKLTREYIENIDLLAGFQRMRWYGWMSNVHLKNTLFLFGIFLTSKAHDKKFRFVSIVYVSITSEDGWYITDDYERFQQKDVLNASMLIKRFFYEIRDPPI